MLRDLIVVAVASFLATLVLNMHGDDFLGSWNTQTLTELYAATELYMV